MRDDVVQLTMEDFEPKKPTDRRAYFKHYEEHRRGPRAQFNVSLTPDELSALNALIEAHGLGKAEFVRGAAHLLSKGLFEEYFK